MTVKAAKKQGTRSLAQIMQKEEDERDQRRQEEWRAKVQAKEQAKAYAVTSFREVFEKLWPMRINPPRVSEGPRTELCWNLPPEVTAEFDGFLLYPPDDRRTTRYSGGTNAEIIIDRLTPSKRRDGNGKEPGRPYLYITVRMKKSYGYGLSSRRGEPTIDDKCRALVREKEQIEHSGEELSAYPEVMREIRPTLAGAIEVKKAALITEAEAEVKTLEALLQRKQDELMVFPNALAALADTIKHEESE